MSETTTHVQPDRPVLYSTKETAKILGVTEKTLCLWRQQGRHQPPYLRLLGKCRYIDVPEWIEENAIRH